MSVDALSQLSTADFLQVTQNADTRTIRLTSSGTVDNTRLPTFVSTNQKTLDGFVAALRRDFGTAIADAAHEQLNSLTNAGSLPLKGFMVREAVDKAVAAVQANINARDRFFSGLDPEHSFQALMHSKLDEFGIKDEALRKVATARAESELRNKVSVTGESRIDVQKMEQTFGRLDTLHALRLMQDISFTERDLPGSLTDKFDLKLMFSSSASLATRAIEMLPLCRQIQPQGRLTRETIWLALTTDKPTSQQITGDDFEFSMRLQEAIQDRLAESVFGGDKAQAEVAFNAGALHYHAAVDIAKTRRAITQEDYIRPETLLGMCTVWLRRDRATSSPESPSSPDYYWLEKGAADLGRLATKNKSGEPAISDILMHLPGGDYRLKCGKTVNVGRPEDGAFKFSNDKELEKYRQGSRSEYTTNLREKCFQLCKDNEVQGAALFALFSQMSQKVFAGTGGACGTYKLIPTLSEHSATRYEVSLDEETGVAKFSLTLDESAETAGTATMTIFVSPEGEYEIKTLNVTFPTNPQAAV